MDDQHPRLTAPQVRVAIRDLPALSGKTRGDRPGRVLLEGVRFGLNHLTLVLGETAPGFGIPLHRHAYEELFIVHGGRGTYTVGEVTVEAGAGDVVLVPSGVPHRFTNHADETLYHTAVHARGDFVVEYLTPPDIAPADTAPVALASRPAIHPKVAIADLPPLVGVKGIVPGRRLLEGCRFGLDHLTLVLGATSPGRPRYLHRHDYEELFIIDGGRGEYVVGDTTVDAGPGEVVLVPAGVVHGFTALGAEPLRHTAVHGSGRFVFELPVTAEDSPDTPRRSSSSSGGSPA